MTDTPPTKEQLKIKKAKEALASMKSAKDNMGIALDRIQSLEGCIANLGALIDDMLELIPEKSFAYRSEESYKSRFKKSKTELMKWL